jgi:beta-lactam-binding protein with PASTA domain
MAAAGTGGSPVLPRGSQVVIVVSQGPNPMPPASYAAVPGVVGQSQGDALTSLQGAGLRTRVFTDFSTTHPKGKVAGQAPRANASVPGGSEVNLLVSNGPAAAEQGLVALPDTIGSSAADASSSLQAAGLNPQLTNEFSQTVPAGVVMDQLPSSIDLAAAPKKTSPWLWVAAVAAVVVIVAGAFFFLRGSQAGMVSVPDVVGMTQDEATTALTDAGFQVQAEEASEPGDAKEGEVVAQDPAAGGEAPAGSSITISVVGAPEAVAVPDVVGLSEDAAAAKLEKVGLRANPRTKEDGSVKPDTVIAQSPAAGAELAPDSRVDIIVAVAPAGSGQVSVPDVTGKSQSNAEGALRDAGLKAVAVENPSESVAKGSVSMQLPTAGTLVTPGAEVAIVVSSGAPQGAATVSVPNVIGQSRADAEAALRAAGLSVQSIGVSGTSEKVGDVFEQAPGAGESVPEASTVTVLYAQ